MFNAAFEEARRRGDRRVGTDYLLLGLLHDPAPARVLGVGLDEGRAALADLDHTALAAIGLDVRGLRLQSPPPPKRFAVTRNTLTAGARDVLAAAVGANSGTPRGLNQNHLLRALLSCPPGEPVSHLLAQLCVDAGAVRARLDHAEP